MAVCALTMLDGVGDEVTVAGGAVLLALALILAWLSTHVAERGDHILGTILTAGAHVSLIGLGGGDAYIGGPSGPDASEPPPASRPQEDKPDDEDPDAGEAAGEGEGASGANVDQLLNIQGLRKRAAGAGSKPRPSPADKPEEEEEEEENEEGEADRSPKQVTAITVRLKFINDTEELAVLRPQDTVGLLKSISLARSGRSSSSSRGSSSRTPVERWSRSTSPTTASSTATSPSHSGRAGRRGCPARSRGRPRQSPGGWVWAAVLGGWAWRSTRAAWWCPSSW
ncbi:transmembrane and ubiquitin-like domain-containing protein 2 isoform X2 [Anguilla anguilla]|uniref:transmembrane and ubiquitin-like domain-containing protein 2 isoform X2 n=1 Tax=Anguilla anguilla TaxID=7936 RepID=UPI0015ACF3B8|nr:transmembrane and ubiquitin-like domain-containing protein 2 isoform X2 [Anguilla anguilla]